MEEQWFVSMEAHETIFKMSSVAKLEFFGRAHKDKYYQHCK